MSLSRIRDSSHPFGMTSTLSSLYKLKEYLSLIKDTAQRGVSVIKGCCL